MFHFQIWVTMKPRSRPHPLLQNLYFLKLGNNYAYPEPPTSSRMKSSLKPTELPSGVPYEFPSYEPAIISYAYPSLDTIVFPINYATGIPSDQSSHALKLSHIMDPLISLTVQ